MKNVRLELIWIIIDLLTSIDFPLECPIRLYGDNKITIHIAENTLFHEITKHIEFNCHIVPQKLEEKIIVTKYVSSRHQLVDLLTKPLGRTWMILFVTNWACMISML